MPDHRPAIDWPTDVVLDGRPERLDDPVTVEEPLEILLAIGDAAPRPLSITMRTPGHDRELAAGLLYAEGLVDGADDILEIVDTPDPDRPLDNRVLVRLRAGIAIDPSATARAFLTSSACGVCGKSAIDSVFAGTTPSPPEGPVVDGALLAGLPAAMRPAQAVFRRTGSIHAAGLYTPEGELVTIHEDVGRHNAVDKVVGERLLAGAVPTGEAVLVVSGRIGFEIAQKALRAGIPILVAVGAPSDLALRVAERGGMTVMGFARDGRANVYTGRHRVRWA